jgi:hypothetical protein
MPYGLVVNGALKELGDVKYLLSPQVIPPAAHPASALAFHMLPVV